MRTDLYQDLYTLEDSHWWHLSKRNTVTALLKRYRKKYGKPIILDIGCGTGKNMEALSSFGTVYGVDNSAHAIKFCKKRKLKNVQLGQAEQLPFTNCLFDVVTILDVLEHVDDGASLKEIARVLKARGIVIITVPAYQTLWSKWDDVLGHKRRYTTSSLQTVLKKEGFGVVKISYLYSFLLIPVVLIRRFKSRVKRSDYGSDFKINTPFINFCLLILSTIERMILSTFAIPFGTSIVCVARKDK